MQRENSKNWKEKGKVWFFQCILIINTCKITHKYLVLLVILLQLTALQYFYVNKNFSFLNNFSMIQQYYQILTTYFLYIVPFQNTMYSVLTLCIYPFVILVILLTKQFGPNKLFLIIIQILNFLYPILSIKIVIAMTNCIIHGKYLYIAIPFGIINLLYGALILYFYSRMHRSIEIPIIIAIQLGLNYYIVMAMLFIRLVILVYLFYPKKQCMFSTYFEISLFLSLLIFMYGEDNTLNYCSFGAIVSSFTFYGAWMIYRQYSQNQDIYERIDNLQENEEELFQIIRLIEEHQTECEITTCRCHSYVSIDDNQELKKFIYQFDEQRLRRKNEFDDKVEYADRCIQKFQLKLSGVIKILEHRPANFIQEYKIYRICRIYEDSLRKQDKNYRHGEAYLNIYEESHNFSVKMLGILKMIKQFWSLIVSFDGSTKFLSSILAISNEITLLREMYERCMLKYDDEGVNFRHMMQLFLAIILNEKMSDEDELAIPEQVIFMITNENRIINVNSNFANMVGSNIEHVVNKSYKSYIPEIYRDAHSQWVQEFIEGVQSYEDRALEKAFALGPIEIKMVQMTHRVLPRFMQGLQIFTKIEYPVSKRQVQEESFIFIVEKDNFYIKHVEQNFFQLSKFKINQRNVKVLQQMNLNSIFQNFTINGGNAPNQTKIFAHFLEEFTYIRKKQQKKAKKGGDQFHQTTNVSRIRKAHNDADNVFEYQILKNSKEEDPYLKILFKLQRSQKKFEENESSESVSQIDQTNSQQQKNKNFGSKQLNFFIPYYLILVLVGIHVLFINISQLFQSTFTTLTDKYNFYLAYDYTLLASLNIFVGKNQVPQLQQLWIRGYGNFSESFNAFESITDPIFSNYFNQSMTTTFHNNLYQQIQSYLSLQIAEVKILSVGLLIILILSLSHYFIDYLLNMRYIFKVQNKVGQLLLQFVIIEESDIDKLIQIIQNFIINILNFKENKNNKEFKLPIETIEESAFQIMRGGISLNNSAQIASQQQMQLVNDLKILHIKKRSTIRGSETERVSLNLLKKQFKQAKENVRSGFPKKSYEKSQSESDKGRTISIFKQNYGSFRYIFAQNKKFFLIITLTMVLSCGMIIGVFFLIYGPTIQFSTQVTILQNLYQSKIILLKSLEQISINNYTLLPQNTVSLRIFDIIKDIEALDRNSYFSDFNTTFQLVLGQNTCNLIDPSFCALIQHYTNLNVFGLNIITQYIQQYFRLKNVSALHSNNSFNTLIQYQQALLDVLILKFTGACESYNTWVSGYEMNLMVVGLLLCFVCLLVNHLSLKYYKNRIEDSSALSKIIPKQIKDKHAFQMGNLNQEQAL